MPRSRARASRSAASRSSGMVKPEGYFTPWSRPNLTVPRPSGETARPVSPSGRCRSWRVSLIMRRLPPRPVRRAADAAVAAARHVRWGGCRLLPGGRRPGRRSRGQRQLGRPADQQASLFGEEGVVRAQQVGLCRLGAIHPQVAHCAWPRSIQGSSFASSRRASAICAASSRATPSASAMSPPRYQTDWPSRVGWVVTVIRGFGPAPGSGRTAVSGSPP